MPDPNLPLLEDAVRKLAPFHWQHSFRISGFDCYQDNASPISFYRTMTREGYKTLGCVVGCGVSSFTLSFSLNLIYCVNGSTSSHLTRILGKC